MIDFFTIIINQKPNFCNRNSLSDEQYLIKCLCKKDMCAVKKNAGKYHEPVVFGKLLPGPGKYIDLLKIDVIILVNFIIFTYYFRQGKLTER